jgi:hypothetical protein
MDESVKLVDAKSIGDGEVTSPLPAEARELE